MRTHGALAMFALLSHTAAVGAQSAQAAPPAETGTGAPDASAVAPAPTSPPPPAGAAPQATGSAAAASPSQPASAVPPQPLAPPAEAPACESPDEPSEGYGAFFIGPGLFDLAELNRHLRAAGYEAIDSPLTLIGGEGHAVLPSGFVMGARGGALSSSDGSGPDGLRRTFSGGFGMADFGYALVRKPALLFTATAGIGGYGMEVGIGDGQSVPFDEVLQNPRRSSSVGRGGVLVGLTLGVDGRISLGPADKRGGRGFFLLGARVGGLYGPPLGSWSLSQGGDASGGPGPGLAGAYAALVVGFGGGRDRPPPAH